MSPPLYVVGEINCIDGETVDAELWQCRRADQHVSKYLHGFFITINSMILYFKHIIHIDDFLLNGHPPSNTIFAVIKLKPTKLSPAGLTYC